MASAIPQIDPKRAHLLMQSGHTYLDVRTIEEYAAGHPAGAVNIPAFVRDSFGQMILSPDFLPVVQANFAPEAPLALGCMSGHRSMRACELLARAGYSNLANVAGSFGGAKDPFGRVLAPGWVQEGLPVETEGTPGASYAALHKRAAEKT
jgi:rhodanese-related sulfurtransferase